ncbi:MAG: hypothetical protein ACO22L_04940, partial [Candidatus Nanopelagicaceae bacterium]
MAIAASLKVLAAMVEPLNLIEMLFTLSDKCPICPNKRLEKDNIFKELPRRWLELPVSREHPF